MLSDSTFEMHIKREGLILHIHVEKLFEGVVDLKEHLKLSDDEAKELLRRLDEGGIADVERR